MREQIALSRVHQCDGKGGEVERDIEGLKKDNAPRPPAFAAAQTQVALLDVDSSVVHDAVLFWVFPQGSPAFDLLSCYLTPISDPIDATPMTTCGSSCPRRWLPSSFVRPQRKLRSILPFRSLALRRDPATAG